MTVTRQHSVYEGVPLIQTELDWIKPYNVEDLDLTKLDGPGRKRLFLQLWNKEETSVQCDTCHATEGRCIEWKCIRLRITHKLSLPWDWS